MQLLRRRSQSRQRHQPVTEPPRRIEASRGGSRSSDAATIERRAYNDGRGGASIEG